MYRCYAPFGHQVRSQSRLDSSFIEIGGLRCIRHTHLRERSCNKVHWFIMLLQYMFSETICMGLGTEVSANLSGLLCSADTCQISERTMAMLGHKMCMVFSRVMPNASWILGQTSITQTCPCVRGRIGGETGVGGSEESRSWVNGIHGRR